MFGPLGKQARMAIKRNEQALSRVREVTPGAKYRPFEGSGQDMTNRAVSIFVYLVLFVLLLMFSYRNVEWVLWRAGWIYLDPHVVERGVKSIP